MHESKYEPMEKTDAEKIMEEILSMQAGLNPDQQVKYNHMMNNVNNKIINTQADANEEAEMIIRAIMQVILCTIATICFMFLIPTFFQG